MKWRPLGANVLVRVDMGEKTTPAGIVLPEATQKVNNMGMVVAVGGAVKDVKLHDRVIFTRFAGEEMPEKDADGVIEVIVPVSDILGAMEE